MRLFVAAFCMFLLTFAAKAGESPGSGNSTAFRIGISYASFGTVSRNDASAALKAWAVTLSRERKLEQKVQVEVFEHESELRKALQDRAVEAASMTAEEFLDCGEQPEYVFLTAKEKSFTQQYVVVVHSNSGLINLEMLKGLKFVRHLNPVTIPALPWLETELAHAGLGRTREFFGEAITLDNPSKCVLRVFFGQSDACLVTDTALQLACELNPQLKKSLRVVWSSPPVIPTLFFFRPGYSSAAYPKLEEAILNLHITPAGQQVLTVFQGSRMLKQPVSCFSTTRALLKEYRGLGNLSANSENETGNVVMQLPHLQ